MSAANPHARLYWQCRRGMLELDLLLQPFLENGYARLSEAERGGFDRLLRCTDQDLLEYLLGQTQPKDGDMVHVIKKIRDTATP